MSIDNIVRSSLFHRFRNTFGKKVIATSIGLIAAACGPPSKELEAPDVQQTQITEKVVNGVKIHQSITNSDGLISFIDYQTKEEVDISISDLDSNQPIGNARVTFIDGDGFEGFITKHNDYLPSLEIFPHNSSHTIKLSPGTSGFSKITQKRYENPTTEFITPMHELVEWGKESALEYQGCQTRDEFIDNYKDTLAVICKVGAGGDANPLTKFCHILSKTVDYGLKAGELLELEETEIVQIYRSNKIVPDFNSLFEAGFYEEEKCGDGIDNDCDGLLDLADKDCPECVYDKKICSDSKTVAKLDTCGNKYDFSECFSDSKCIDGICIVGGSDCNYSKSICLDSTTKAKKDTCGNTYAITKCEPNESCSQGTCIDDGCDFSHTICTDSNTKASVDTCGATYNYQDCPDKCVDGGCKTDDPSCTFSYNTCLDSKTKAAVDTCGNTYNTQTCPDKCVDGSCTTSSNCEPLVGTCLDDYTTGWKDQCGNSGQTGTCTGGQVCEGNGNCVDDVEECDTSKFTDFYCVTNKLAKSVETCPDGTGVLLYCAANETCVDGKCVD